MSNKTKKYLKLFTSFALVAAIAVGVTLAALSTITETKTNKFTSSKGITGEITESEWKYEEEGWTDYLPGESTNKNPVITIKSKDSAGLNVGIAMKVVCQDNNGKDISLADFQTMYGTVAYKTTNDKGEVVYVDGINPAWTVDPNNEFIYYYNDTVAATEAGVSTTALFDRVTVLAGIQKVYGTTTSTETIRVYEVDENGVRAETPKTETTGQVLVNSTEKVYTVDADGNETEVTGNATLPSFEIKVTGYATQAENQNALGALTAKDKLALKALAGFPEVTE